MRTRSKAKIIGERVPGDEDRIGRENDSQGGKNLKPSWRDDCPANKPKDGVGNLWDQACKSSTKERRKSDDGGDSECVNVLRKKQRPTDNVEVSVNGCSAASPSRASEDIAKMDKETRRNKPKDGEGASGCDSQSIIHGKLIEDGLTNAFQGGDRDTDELAWEEGSVSYTCSTSIEGVADLEKNVTVEFSTPTCSKKQPRRASAKDKELAELVHKVHLLCLLARGRLVDAACDDPLIQASLLSILPSHLLNLSEKQKLTANMLVPLVEWLRNNFCVHNQNPTERSFKLCLSSVIEAREGNSEEVAALSVALFRALGLTTRFVSVLDAAPLKPDIDNSGDQEIEKVGKDKFHSPFRNTVPCLGQLFTGLPPCASRSAKMIGGNLLETSHGEEHYRSPNDGRGSIPHPKESSNASQLGSEFGDEIMKSQFYETNNKFVATDAHASGSKRKGDLEFEMQMQMALSATAATVHEGDQCKCSNDLPNELVHGSPRDKKTKGVESLLTGKESSSAFWTRKNGAPLYWAEVYSDGEMLTGKWVHVDAVNAIVDGESKVEAAVAAYRKILRYVVAFAGYGVKDVTRRYCMKWYTIASKRIDASWWHAVVAPLKELESGATDGITKLEALKSGVSSRSSLEDMELETRALTEPLPTNQQAYRNHHLYAIERWLTKYQVLYPKGPLLGYCSGHPVYPRTCVQTLYTKQRWLREGLQVKETELPAKVVKHSRKINRIQTLEEGDESNENECKGTLDLYGKWQTEVLSVPHAIDGIVPKNGRGQVEVWSEKCVPPGTVHLKLPRLETVARRLGVDFAPAMVGFEFRNGLSFPVFEGIVVCQEFRDAVLEAYAEEEERREAQEKLRNEALAISRWTQLLSSMITRQRLKNSYEKSSAHAGRTFCLSSDQGLDLDHQKMTSETCIPNCSQENKFTTLPVSTNSHHEHVFPAEYQSFDEESSVRTKRCPCGFSVQVEEI